MGPLDKLKRANERVAFLALLAVKGIKPASRIDGYEGPEKPTEKLMNELGLETEFSNAGCRTDIVFGTHEGMKKLKEIKDLRGWEKFYQRGLAFGYPDCCARFYADMIEGKAEGEPDKMPPLEHFACPGCKASPELLKKYKDIKNELG